MSDDEDVFMEDSMDEDGYFDDDVEDDEDEEEDGDDPSFFAPVVAEKDVRKPYEVEFHVYSVQDIVNFQNKEVRHVSGILGCQEAHAATLLRHYHWNKERLIERYMDNPDDVLADAGVILESSKQPRFVLVNGFECSICYADDPGMETLALSCGHRFCRDCYERYLTQKISEEGESRRIQCLDSNCKLIVDEKTVELSVPPKVFENKSNATDLFEDNQRDLEMAVEQLSELLEKPIEPEKIAELKQQVLDKSVYVSTRREVLLTATSSDLAENKWTYNIDLKTGKMLETPPDALIRVWEGESGKLLNTLSEHIGWITNLLFCKELKILFSASIDGLIVVWGPSGKTLQKIQTGSPIYSLAYNSRRQQLLAGYNKKVRVFQAISSEDNHTSTDVLEKKSISAQVHNDVVSCMISCEGRFYSAGYDKKIVIYEFPHHGDQKLNVAQIIPNAHDAAISCMVYGKDADNSWLITGSFDRVVKLWSLDGNLLQRFDGFSDTITSVSYVLPTQTLWVTANSPAPIVYDPRSGINVSDFVTTTDETFHQRSGTLAFKQLIYVPEVNEVIGITNRRTITIWKYNPVCLIILRSYQKQTTNNCHSQEALTLPKEEKLKEDVISNSFSRNPEERRKKQAALHKRVSEKLNSWKRGLEEDLKHHETQVEFMSSDALRTFRRKQMKLRTQLHDPKPIQVNESDVPNKKASSNINGQESASTTRLTSSGRPSVLSLCYYEELDLLVSGYEDSKIHVWGYNEEVVKYVQEEDKDKDALDANGITSDSVTNRVAGMTLKATFNDHKDAVAGIACFSKDNNHWMLSAGWDRRICVYDLKQQRLHDVFRNSTQKSFGKEELAADGIILDLEYNPDRNEFGYASSDKLAYIRRFSPKGDEMLLQAVLVGHEGEVTKIRWNKKYQQWVTGSEDRTIRIWAAEGLPMMKVLNNDGPVSALCIDAINGCIIAGSQDKCIRVFDQDKKDEVVQKNLGHTDEVRSIIHIPVRNQYVSASWDNNVRVWNAYLKKGQKRITAKTASAFYNNPTVNMFEDNEEQAPAFSEKNPLVMPKLLSKPMYVKEITAEKPSTAEDTAAAAKGLEEELKTTLNDLEYALAGEKPRRRR
ncbi:hypothetical protein HDV05_008533 [Chytridiales sp. JEL 0842]|nr:hypothetical protein HDV05_008533 [Chytridiales sp. JEL 0842]